MPNTKAAKKRLRQSLDRRAKNRAIKSVVRTHLRRVDTALQNNEIETAEAAFRETCSKLDKAGARGTIHPNKAARLKSRMSARIKAAKG
ncbi:MAG: 30S ribosomal protein S20 [Pirellulales bacterium]|nr:30S ribosomal protein S20 [Pirellulales bacterium]